MTTKSQGLPYITRGKRSWNARNKASTPRNCATNNKTTNNAEPIVEHSRGCTWDQNYRKKKTKRNPKCELVRGNILLVPVCRQLSCSSCRAQRSTESDHGARAEWAKDTPPSERELLTKRKARLLPCDTRVRTNATCPSSVSHQKRGSQQATTRKPVGNE